MMPRAPPCVQRALKAQKYKAWGNAPGTQPPNYCRAVGAKAVQAERITHGGTIPGALPQALYFCIKQATPWPLEQAHGDRLALFLRFQRALVVEALSQVQ